MIRLNLKGIDIDYDDGKEYSSIRAFSREDGVSDPGRYTVTPAALRFLSDESSNKKEFRLMLKKELALIEIVLEEGKFATGTQTIDIRNENDIDKRERYENGYELLSMILERLKH